jgi:hypothetical protein
MHPMPSGPTPNLVQGHNYATMRKFTSQQHPFSMKSPFQRGLVFLNGERSRLNGVAIALAVLSPWLLFCFVSYIFAFWLRYGYPGWADTAVIVAFLVSVVPAGYWAARSMKGKLTDPSYVPTWWIFLFITLLLAYVVGFSFAEYNFEKNLRPYYDLNNLETYSNIDTTEFLGMQLQDAGKISFKHGTTLDLGHSMGFKNHDVYCVSPIRTEGGAGKSSSIDFWAVGKNCCSGVQADFHCSGFSDPQATGALRLMMDDDRAFYRLAVQQAEATYKLTANHPLFFRWVHDAEEEVNKFWRTGLHYFVLGAITYLIFQTFLVACTTLALAKLIHP